MATSEDNDTSAGDPTSMTDDFDFFARSPLDRDVAVEDDVVDLTPPPTVLRAEPVMPGAPAVPATVRPERDRDKPTALFFPSQEGGTGYGHVVILRANDELACTCWPSLRSARGCHAMVDARALLGLPAVE